MVQSYLIKKKYIYSALVAFLSSILLSILLTYYISFNSITQLRNCKDSNSTLYSTTFSKTNKTVCMEFFCNIDYNSICHEKYTETAQRGNSFLKIYQNNLP